MSRLETGTEVVVHRPEFEDNRRVPPGWTTDMDEYARATGKISGNRVGDSGETWYRVVFEDGESYLFRRSWMSLPEPPNPDGDALERLG